MTRLPLRRHMLATLAACSCMALLPLTSSPLNAETLEELDALSDLSTDEAAGTAAARDMAQRGEYLDALATLERVLAVHPTSADALLMHAVYLCEIDDSQGGLLEISRLNERNYGAQMLNEARAMCAPGRVRGGSGTNSGANRNSGTSSGTRSSTSSSSSSSSSSNSSNSIGGGSSTSSSSGSGGKKD